MVPFQVADFSGAVWGAITYDLFLYIGKESFISMGWVISAIQA
jgi:hypothetical protein